MNIYLLNRESEVYVLGVWEVLQHEEQHGAPHLQAQRRGLHHHRGLDRCCCDRARHAGKFAKLNVSDCVWRSTVQAWVNFFLVSKCTVCPRSYDPF